MEPRDAGAASGVLLTATQIANALGIAVLGGAPTAAAGLGTRGAFAVGTAAALLLAALTGIAALTLERPTRRPKPRQTNAQCATDST